MIKMSIIDSYLNKHTGKWTPGRAVERVASYSSLHEFFTQHPVQETAMKGQGSSICPWIGRDKKQLAVLTAKIKDDTTGEWALEKPTDEVSIVKRGGVEQFQFHIDKHGRSLRADKNILRYGCIILDFDVYDPSIELLSSIKAAIAAKRWGAVIHSSFSHGSYREGYGTKQGYHVILEMDRECKASEWRGMFASIADHFSDHGAVVDGVTKDLSRLYFGVVKNKNTPENWYHEFIEGGMVAVDDHAKTGAVLLSNQEFKAKARVEKEREKGKQLLGLAPGENVLGKIRWSSIDIEDLFADLGLECKETKPAKGGSGFEWTFRFVCDAGHGGADDAFCSFTPGQLPMVVCSHTTCEAHGGPGQGPGATRRFFESHWDEIPAEYKDEEVYMLKRKVKTTPKAAAAAESEVGGDPEVVIMEGGFEGELDLGQKKSDDIISIYRLPLRNILVTAPTGAGKTTANIQHAVEALSAGERVLYVCSTKAEMGQFDDAMRKVATEDMMKTVVFHSSENTNIPESATMVVTHHHYLLRAGMMDVYYPVVDWADGAVVIIDEVDALMALMAKSIPLSVRTTKFKDGYTHYSSKCPSRAAKRYQCDLCVKCTKIPLRAFAQRIWTPYVPTSGVSDYDMGNPEVFYPSENPALRRIKDERTLFNSELHTLQVKRLEPLGVTHNTHVLDPDEKLTYMSGMRWMDTIIAESEDVTLVQTNDDLGDLFQEAFARYKSEYIPEEGDDADERLKKSIKYANAQMKQAQMGDKLRLFPSHPCGVQELHYVDTHVLKIVVDKAVRVRYSTGTMSPRKKRVLENIHGGFNPISFVDISNTEFVPIENLTLVLVEETLSARELMDIHDARAVGATDSSHGMKVGKSLLIAPTIRAKTEIGLKSPRVALYDHETRRAAVAEGYQGGKWETLVTYSRSPLGRGMNLGDFSSCTIDSAVFKPMYAYDFSEANALEDVQEEERDSYIAQNAGRILRRPMHIINGKWEVVGTDEIPWANDRFILIHGVEFMDTAARRLVKQWQNMVKNPINVIKIDDAHNLNDGDNAERVEHLYQQHWKHVTQIEALPFQIPQEFLEVDYQRACRKSAKYSGVVSAEEHNRLRDGSKELNLFKRHVEKFSGLGLDAKKDAVNWKRLKKDLSAEMLEKYGRWFELSRGVQLLT